MSDPDRRRREIDRLRLACALGMFFMLGQAASMPVPEGEHHVYSASGYDITPLEPARVEDLAKDLKPQERDILLGRGTEPAFCGRLLDNKEAGVYVCRLCGLPLFSSEAKFHSGTGWPSFYQPFDPDHVRHFPDTSFGMSRTEIRCARCGSHLGHVFDDGPRPTGLRYCMNSGALRFYAKGAALPSESRPAVSPKTDERSTGAKR
jgi:methionine-R-sulfoxide reductase